MMIQVTLTGVDAKTDIDALPTGCEIGVLYTETPEGRNRYPERAELLRMLRDLRGRNPVALHVCGHAARLRLQYEQIPELIECIARIQVNGVLREAFVEGICRQYPNCEIITQHTPANYGLLLVATENHSVLVDRSGGRGISPASWERPITGKSVGFAGGLGPLNLCNELPRIQAVAAGHWWIDLESKLRDDDDWFDPAKACAVMDQIRSLDTL